MSELAFPGSYADWKLVKTRGVIQVVFEVPLHEADAAYQVLGGMPNAAKERWFGIAPLQQLEDHAALLDELDDPLPAPSPRQVAPDKMLAQQAGMVCKDPQFWDFMGASDEAGVVEAVRKACGVRSRSEIKPGTMSGEIWEGMYQDFLRRRKSDGEMRSNK